MVELFPAIEPGLRVQFPAGRPLKSIFPVATEQLGWVIELTVGAAGVIGWPFITTLDDAAEIHPTEFVTVKV